MKNMENTNKCVLATPQRVCVWTQYVEHLQHSELISQQATY